MRFIGQKKIIKELNLLLNFIKKGNNANILFRAPSGYGKTTLGLICLHLLKNSRYYLGDEFFTHFDKKKQVHFIDEIHLIKNPEPLYPLMDKGEFTFIFATNESGSLKEPLKNRCVQFVFENYTENELKMIAKDSLKGNFSDKILEYIIKKGMGNPRIIKSICFRINYIVDTVIKNENEDELLYLINNTLNLGEEKQINIYLSFLEKMKRASLTTIIASTKLDKDTIIYEIEPTLIRQNKLRITSRGREIINS